MKLSLMLAAGLLMPTFVDAGPMKELWRNGLVSISPPSPQLEYRASAVAMDDAGNLFVGGSVQLLRGSILHFPFVAKFDKTGLKAWEYWPTTTSDSTITDSLTSDGRGGAYAALRSTGGGVQLVWLSDRGFGFDLAYASNYWTFGYEPLNSVHLAADGSNGFYLTGIIPQSPTIGVPGKLSVARYDPAGSQLWCTNLFDCYLNPRGLERTSAVHSNAVFVCDRLGLTQVSQLARVDSEGNIHWQTGSGLGALWSQLAVLNDEAIGVAGDDIYQVFSGQGSLLAAHRGWGHCSLARQSGDADGFLVSDWGPGTLVRLGREGQIRNLGLLPGPAQAGVGGASGQNYPMEIVNLTTNQWLVAANDPGFYSLTSQRLQFFQFDDAGDLQWRQRLAGYEFVRTTTDQRNPWLLRAADGTVRLVGNLSTSAENPHLGVAVVAFSLTDQPSSITQTNPLPTFTNQGPEEVVLRVGATGIGPLKYQWQYWGLDLLGQTNDTITITGTGDVYSVRISDNFGELTSHAVSVGSERPNLKFEADQYLGVGLAIASSYGKEFFIESSTDLQYWTTHSTLYSRPVFIPINALPGSAPHSGNRFFRTRNVYLY